MEDTTRVTLSSTLNPNTSGGEDDDKTKKTFSITNNEACKLVAKSLSHSNNLPHGCVLYPHSTNALFVAWNGVLVLVYNGFPPAMTHAKQVIARSVPHLKRENFGSQWPKTTLAAVQDDADPLLLDDLQRLKRICMDYSSRIASEMSHPIPIQTLSAVHYSCRSLEKLDSRVDIALGNAKAVDIATQEEKAVVDSVVGEWNSNNLTAYLAKVNAPGSRISSYREESHAGATCVAFLHPLPGQIRNHIASFREAVEEQFPGRYAWLQEESWHCTLRSLDQDESVSAS